MIGNGQINVLFFLRFMVDLRINETLQIPPVPLVSIYRTILGIPTSRDLLSPLVSERTVPIHRGLVGVPLVSIYRGDRDREAKVSICFWYSP